MYGRFYIELTKNIAYENNPVIFIVLSPFLENSDLDNSNYSFSPLTVRVFESQL